MKYQVSNDHTIKTFTAIDIEKYHKGELSAREMHAMEKAALDDPFLADALEGYAVPGVNAATDIAELKKRLDDRTSRQSKVIPIVPGGRSSFPWFRAAAMVILIAGSGYFIYKLAFSDKKQDSYAVAPIPDTTTPETKQITDSITVHSGLGAFSKKAKPEVTVDSSTDYESYASDNSSNYIMPGKELEISGNIAASDSLVANKSFKLNNTHKWQNNLQISTDTARLNFGALNYYTATPSGSAPGRITPPQLDSIFGPRKQLSEQKDKAWAYKSVPKAAEQKNEGFIAERKDTGYRVKSRLSDSNADGIAEDFDEYKKRVATNAKRQPQAMQGMVKENNQPRYNIFRGRITDANQNALPFANITNTADNVGTYSDVKGNFVLTSPDSVLNVQVRSVGFESNNIQLQPTLRDNQVIMREDYHNLNEVVVSNRAMNINRARNNTLVHEEPEPEDGWSNYDIYIANNLNMPDTLKRQLASKRGEVELSFEVNEKGEPINITVDRSLCASCDKEAIRLLKQGPKWKHKSRKKRTSVTISF